MRLIKQNRRILIGAPKNTGKMAMAKALILADSPVVV
jgi:hypothetical protein